MNKPTAIAHIKKERGFLPYSKVFEIYNDTEEVPKELINLCIATKQPRVEILPVGSQEIADALNEAFKKYNLK